MAKNKFFKRTVNKLFSESIQDIMMNRLKKVYDMFFMKFDGEHAELHIDKKGVRFISRGGHDISHLIPYLVNSLLNFADLKHYHGVYACELVSLEKVIYNPTDAWNHSQRVLGCKEYNTHEDRLNCIIYDVHLRAKHKYNRKDDSVSYAYRYYHLLFKHSRIESNREAFAKQILGLRGFYKPTMYPIDKLETFFDKSVVELKREGVVIFNSMEETLWHHTFTKLKPLLELEVIVLGYNKGKKGTKVEGMLGSFDVGLYKDGRMMHMGKVPTMTDKERKYWTKRMIAKDNNLYVIQIKADAVTKKNKFKFPRYVRERTDKLAKECTWKQL